MQLAYEQFRSQLSISPGAGDHYIAVNNKQGPFANINVRKAFWAALDRVAMNKARGGSLVTDVMTHFIYPEIPGFEDAGGLQGPKVDYNEHPEGDHGGRRKVHEARGLPERQVHRLKDAPGRRRRPATPPRRTPKSPTSTLKNLGFKTKLSLVDQSVMYSKYCGVPAEEIDVCPNVGWVADFADGQAVLDVAVQRQEHHPRRATTTGAR